MQLMGKLTLNVFTFEFVAASVASLQRRSWRGLSVIIFISIAVIDLAIQD